MGDCSWRPWVFLKEISLTGCGAEGHQRHLLDRVDIQLAYASTCWSLFSVSVAWHTARRRKESQ